MLMPTLVFVALTFLPLVDIVPEAGGSMAWIAALAILLSLPALFRGVAALRGAESLVLLGLWFVVTISRPAQGWFGGALPAFAEFAVPALCYYLVVIALKDLRKMRIFAIALTATALVICIMALREYHSPDTSEDSESEATFVMEQSVSDPDGGEEPLVLKRIRATGTLADPNDFAQFLLVVFPFLLVLWESERPLRSLIILLAPAAILAYTIYLTNSRGALMGIGAMGVAALYRKFGWKTAALMLLIAVPVFVLVYSGRSISADEESAQGRIQAWSEGLQMLKQNPVFGVGFRNFTDYHELTAHNSFVLCFAELGLTGYFFWLSLLICSFLGLKQVGDAPGESGRWSFALTLSLIGYASTAFFLSRTYATVLYVLVGMIVALKYQNADVPAAARPPHWAMIAACGVAVSPVATYVIVRLAQTAT